MYADGTSDNCDHGDGDHGDSDCGDAVALALCDGHTEKESDDGAGRCRARGKDRVLVSRGHKERDSDGVEEKQPLLSLF